MCHRVYSALSKVKMGLELHLTAQGCIGLGLDTPMLNVAQRHLEALINHGKNRSRRVGNT
jgi:hypothetical protein